MKRLVAWVVVLALLSLFLCFKFGVLFEMKKANSVKSWNTKRERVVQIFGNPDTTFVERFYSEAEHVKENEISHDATCLGYFFWLGKMKTFCFLSDTLASYGTEERCLSCK